MHRITSLAQLEQHYPAAPPRVYWRDLDHISDQYAEFIRRAPFMILATHGEAGPECSTRGDAPGFVRIVNSQCLHIPDRRGENCLDSLRNILHDPQVGLVFMVPGVGETLRVTGRANLVVEQQLRESFSVNGEPASAVITVQVERALFQSQKAIRRSRLWDADCRSAYSPPPEHGPGPHRCDHSRATWAGVDEDAQGDDIRIPQMLY